MMYAPQNVVPFSSSTAAFPSSTLPKPQWLASFPADEAGLLTSKVAHLIQRFGNLVPEMKSDLQRLYPLSRVQVDELERWVFDSLMAQQHDQAAPRRPPHGVMPPGPIAMDPLPPASMPAYLPAASFSTVMAHPASQANMPTSFPPQQRMGRSLPHGMPPIHPVATSMHPPTSSTSSTPPSGTNGSDVLSSGSSQELRKGKWTIEEEEYTRRLVQHFNSGLLMIPEGTTLRAFLSNRLKCDRMRITKKFRGICFGRKYRSCERTSGSQMLMQAAEEELRALEARFMVRNEQERDKKQAIADDLALMTGGSQRGSSTHSARKTEDPLPPRRGKDTAPDQGRLSSEDVSLDSSVLSSSQAERVANLLEKPSEALLLILGQKYLGQLKKQARTKQPKRADDSAVEGNTVDVSLGDGESQPDSGTATLLSSESILPASTSMPSAQSNKRPLDQETLHVDSSSAGETLPEGKRVKVMTCEDEDANAGKLLLGFFNEVNKGEGEGEGEGEALKESSSGPQSPDAHHPSVPRPEVMDALRKANSVPGKGRQVLVADDSLTTRRFLKRQLETNGYDVETADNGQVALESMKQKSYDIVFLDLEMPIMNGFSCSAAFRDWERKNNREKRQPICVLSVHAGDKEREKCAEVGADFFEAKPARIPGLMKIADLCVKLQGRAE